MPPKKVKIGKKAAKQQPSNTTPDQQPPAQPILEEQPPSQSISEQQAPTLPISEKPSREEENVSESSKKITTSNGTG